MSTRWQEVLRNSYSSKRRKWSARYIDISKSVASWSKDPRYKVGAVIIGKQGQIISQGYNGFPRGMDDYSDRYADSETKRKFVVHAEMNAIYNATLSNTSVRGATLYVWGLPPCNECTKGIIQSGIKHIVICAGYDIPDKWEDSFETSKIMLKECKVSFEMVDLDGNTLYNV